VGNHWMNNSYSITKTTAERFALMYRKEFSIPITVIRALNAFGERQKAFPVRKIMPSFIGRALRGEDIQVYGDGSQEMDMVYVGDVAIVLVDALDRLLDKGMDSLDLGEAGRGVGLQVKDIAELVIKHSGSKSKVEYLPMRPGEEVGSRVVAEKPTQINISSKKHRDNNGYLDFEFALKRTIEWYKKYYKQMQ